MKQKRRHLDGAPNHDEAIRHVLRSTHSRTQGHPLRDEVATKAFLIYETQGCLHGNDVQHWLEAEAQTNATSDAALRLI